MENNNNKIYLCGLTSRGNVEDLEELLKPIYDYFDGLNFVCHIEQKDSFDLFPEAERLENYKKQGHIEYVKFYKRFDFARNHYLYNGLMKEGDWGMCLDSKERLSPEFCAQILPQLINQFDQKGVDGGYFKGKLLMFRWNEWLKYENSVHETLRGLKNPVELSHIGGEKFKWEDHFWNVRNRREKMHFVKHYYFYYNLPASIHCLLGCENKIDHFNYRQKIREEFRKAAQKINFPLDTKESEEYIKTHGIPKELLKFFNEEKILNDFAGYVLGIREEFPDNHDWEDKVDLTKHTKN